jgi:hypothetical protein
MNNILENRWGFGRYKDGWYWMKCCYVYVTSDGFFKVLWSFIVSIIVKLTRRGY